MEVIEEELARVGAQLHREQLSSGLSMDSPSVYRFSGPGIEKAASVFGLGTSARLFAMWTWPSDDRPHSSLVLTVESSAWDQSRWNGRLRTTRHLFEAAGSSVDEGGAAWARIMSRISAPTAAVWAGIGLGYWPQDMRSPPYECYYPIREEEGESRADRNPRGYHWGNLLSKGHVAALGGVGAVEERCRELGLTAEPVDAGTHAPALLVRGAKTVSTLTDERLGAVRDLLDPILIRRDYIWYAGWPVQVFKQPGTAHREIPVTSDADRWIFDDDEPPSTDDDDG
ncbi:hypothetical protein [Embleya sp. NPDC005575]|uniref:hypothetical protein n=1 Tax=Embleya sp. NPDC005575 TaxID=3156892 RepID=UPI0033BDB779